MKQNFHQKHNPWMEAAMPSRHNNSSSSTRLHVAVIAATDRVLVTLAARDDSQLMDSLATYVGTHARERLWPNDADEVLAKLACGDRSGAVDDYFARTGQRWDCERLHQEVLEMA